VTGTRGEISMLPTNEYVDDDDDDVDDNNNNFN
jgi:hypothetical protein